MSCSRVFPCAFSAQGTLSALRPTMGLCAGAGQRGADLCPPDTSAHHGLHLLRAGGHVRGKGARCVRVPCLLMHQHAVMCALSCSPLPAPALPFRLGVCNMCMGTCVCVGLHGCLYARVRVRAYVLLRLPFSRPLASPPLAPPLLPFSLLCRILLSPRPACFLSPPLASFVPYHPLPFPPLPSPPLPSTLPSPPLPARG